MVKAPYTIQYSVWSGLFSLTLLQQELFFKNIALKIMQLVCGVIKCQDFTFTALPVAYCAAVIHYKRDVKMFRTRAPTALHEASPTASLLAKLNLDHTNSNQICLR